MVSGFLTSPCDHARMSSAVARPIRNSSKKLTSSTGCTSLSVEKRWFPWTAGQGLIRDPGGWKGRTLARAVPVRGPREVGPAPCTATRQVASGLVHSHLVDQIVDRGRLIARQVDSEVGRSALE